MTGAWLPTFEHQHRQDHTNKVVLVLGQIALEAHHGRYEGLQTYMTYEEPSNHRGALSADHRKDQLLWNNDSSHQTNLDEENKGLEE